MDKNVQQYLLQINHDFYSSYAGSFSSTRKSIQPGVKRIVSELPAKASILDLGCGNGNLARHLTQQNFQGNYLGVDSSPELIREATISLSSTTAASNYRFVVIDLSNLHWKSQFSDQAFTHIFAFAVLHHLPGRDIHQQFFRNVTDRLVPGGLFNLSVWQVYNSPRLHSHIVPWETVNLPETGFSSADILMDWRAESAKETPALRYVHVFSAAELLELGKTANLELLEEFFSDGKSCNLGLYQVWQKPAENSLS